MRLPWTLLTLAAAAALAPPLHAGSRTWDFRVLLDGTPIGYHRVVLRDSASERELTSEARFDVKVLGFNAYRYVHHANERWRDGCLAGLTARTDDNGERLTVDATRGAEHLTVASTRTKALLAGCVMSFAYWNPAILKESRLLNAQTGEYETVSVQLLGEESLTVRGQPVFATRYRITGPRHPIDLWYSPQAEWLQLESTVRGGRRLRYQLQ